MTEADWLACSDPALMRTHLPLASERKLYLFGCACCRRLWHLFPDERSRRAVEVGERVADGLDQPGEREHALSEAETVQAEMKPNRLPESAPSLARWAFDATEHMTSAAIYTVYRDREDETVLDVDLGCSPAVAQAYAALRASMLEDPHQDSAGQWKQLFNAERAAQASFFRDIFGNPFRPVAFDPEWRTLTVVALANHMYESRDFTAMPILADALQDANCDNADILDHCRQPGEHVRGCWVIDIVLGKT